ncbi:MAG: hypothetical protein HKN32_08250, partial [Flavobacteriales bacterium]|nr:hypothetical protein [Flavobacteriales bacterium]
MKHIQTVILTLCLLVGLSSKAQSFKFRHFGDLDGISTLFVYSIDQNEHGYLMVGTDKGLFKFDGFRFESFAEEDSLTQN